MAARLAEFARGLRAALHAVSLYPAGHPAIREPLGRLETLSGRLVATGPFRLTVLPDRLLLDGRAPAQVDVASSELAALLHRHLVGELTVRGGIEAVTWRSLLLLLARAPEEVRSEGGIGHTWTSTGVPELSLRELDYAKALREEASGKAGGLEAIIAACLASEETGELNDAALAALMAIVGDRAQFGQFLKELQQRTTGGAKAQAASVLRVLKGLASYAARQSQERLDHVLTGTAAAASNLIVGVMREFQVNRDDPGNSVESVNVVGEVLDRMSDSAVAMFVASAILTEGGASARLAKAFQTLAPDPGRQSSVLPQTAKRLLASPLGQQANFLELWRSIETMLVSYTDKETVGDAYEQELARAADPELSVDQVSDDPPERVATWRATVSDPALRAVDVSLLLDLLLIQKDPTRWHDVLASVVDRIAAYVTDGHLDAAAPLAAALAHEAADQQSPLRASAARAALDRLVGGQIPQHIINHLRAVDDAGFAQTRDFVRAVGPVAVKMLFDALEAEEDARALRRLAELIAGFGAPGVSAIDPLVRSSSWKARRKAIMVLTEVGGVRALGALEPLLRDPEPMVRREALRAVILTGDERAYALITGVLVSRDGQARDAIAEELRLIRDSRMSPLLAYLLRHVSVKRTLRGVHALAIEGLARFGGHVAVEALRSALYRSSWRAPLLSAALRDSAAAALRRLGTAEAIDALRTVAAQGPRGARAAARKHLAGAATGARTTERSA